MKNQYPSLRVLSIQGDETSEFLSRIQGYITSRRYWRLVEDWIFFSDKLNCRIKIPKGFTFDGSSVPRILWTFIPPTGNTFMGAIVHDFCYRFNMLIMSENDVNEFFITKNVGKTKADDLFYSVSRQFDGGLVEPLVAKLFLRMFGNFAWEEARKRNWKIETTNPSPRNRFLTLGINEEDKNIKIKIFVR